jgi:thiosulfate/3-mercaptopyruvate sulfurtransferase
MIPPFVDAEFVATHPAAVLADVRWYLDGRDGRAAFESGHIADAVWVDLDDHLAGSGQPDTEGRHPFPAPATFAASMGSLGIANETVVIAYDDTGGLTAGRLAVMLRMLGCNAAVLAGGLGAWTGPVETGAGRTPAPVDFTAVDWPTDRLASADDVARIVADGGVAIDARSHERFLGDVVQIDKVGGHIPGARSAPWSAVLDGAAVSNKLGPRSAADLRDYFQHLGIDDNQEVVAYCGSGVSACMNVLAMERAGFAAPRLYVASWSGWSADPDRKAATGA